MVSHGFPDQPRAIAFGITPRRLISTPLSNMPQGRARAFAAARTHRMGRRVLGELASGRFDWPVTSRAANPRAVSRQHARSTGAQ
eukprot:113667-Lingulodinium_polyedra.AAC.1